MVESFGDCNCWGADDTLTGIRGTARARRRTRREPRPNGLSTRLAVPHPLHSLPQVLIRQLRVPLAHGQRAVA